MTLFKFESQIIPFFLLHVAGLSSEDQIFDVHEGSGFVTENKPPQTSGNSIGWKNIKLTLFLFRLQYKMPSVQLKQPN